MLSRHDCDCHKATQLYAFVIEVMHTRLSYFFLLFFSSANHGSPSIRQLRLFASFSLFSCSLPCFFSHVFFFSSSSFSFFFPSSFFFFLPYVHARGHARITALKNSKKKKTALLKNSTLLRADLSWQVNLSTSASVCCQCVPLHIVVAVSLLIFFFRSPDYQCFITSLKEDCIRCNSHLHTYASRGTSTWWLFIDPLRHISVFFFFFFFHLAASVSHLYPPPPHLLPLSLFLVKHSKRVEKVRIEENCLPCLFFSTSQSTFLSQLNGALHLPSPHLFFPF